MVFRFPISFFSIVFGLLCCIVSFIDLSYSNLTANYVEKRPIPILIIDPGHGGDDGGAVGEDGVRESDINLAISLQLKSLCQLYGVKSLMTRESDVINYPTDALTVRERKIADQKMRLRLIQDYPDGILYSIHQNFYPSRLPSGVQVLYGHNDSSREIGTMLHDNLTNILCPQSRRVATEIDDTIFLLKHCNCPAVLIECGFLSNPSEAALLQNESYQKKISAILLSSYLEYFTLNRNE